jgi:hypothetical protein
MPKTARIKNATASQALLFIFNLSFSIRQHFSVGFTCARDEERTTILQELKQEAGSTA